MKAAGDSVLRDVLPIPDRPHTGLTTYDAKDPDTSFPPIEPLRPPAGAPNVLVVMLDDVGFGASSAFGGPIDTPVFERLAAGGLRYNRFHTTALCSPTRQALLTGRNHHSVGMSGITEMATSAPGSNTLRSNRKATIPQILKLNGYATSQFGKCHEVPVWETSSAGPFDNWPTGGAGFEYFYGFVAAETNQWYPALYENTIPIDQPRLPEEGYHLTEDLADKAIAWFRQQKALLPDKPFFTYWAPGACHAPHHVPKEWIDRYKGRFDKGWDAVREETLARQKELGVVPPDAVLTERHEGIPAWDDVPEDLRPVFARQMEVYAGFLEHTDHQVGRLIATLEEMGILGDTLVYVIIGDNGASAEGTLQGTFNELLAIQFPGVETPEYLIERIDQLGTPEAYNHYAVGWAHAMNAPYQWTKQVASHFGGTRNGTIVHWPGGIKAKGEIRSQFTHIIDVGPTLLEAAGIPEPTFVNGVQQSPIEGTSMLYTFDAAEAPGRHETQYFEMIGNRGIYHEGWTAVTKHRTPWETAATNTVPFDEDVWELYDTNTDWSQAHDLAAEMPDKLAYLQRLWLIEAVKYDVLPLDDRLIERVNSDLAGRPSLVKGNTQLLYGGMGRLNENCVLNLKNKSWSATAQIVVPEGGAHGAIVAQGGHHGGWSLYAVEGELRYVFNFFGYESFVSHSEGTLTPGEHQVRMEFAYDGGGLAKGGGVTLFVDGRQVGSGRVERTAPMLFSLDETCDVGADTISQVTEEYGAGGGRFTGEVKWVQLDIDAAAADEDHLITAEERYRIVVARQ